MVSEEKIDKARFVLYLRCLQLLTSALKLSQKEISSGRLWTSNNVRSGEFFLKRIFETFVI